MTYGSDPARWARVDAAVEAEAEAAFAFLERLVAEASTVGAERGAQDISLTDRGRATSTPSTRRWN
jgi:hypothetical protein